MQRKRCTRCGEEKPLSEFVRDQYSLDGRTSSCRRCRNAYARSMRDLSAGEREEKRRADLTARVSAAADRAATTAATIDPLRGAWLAGFTDGEGTFEVRIARPKSGRN